MFPPILRAVIFDFDDTLVNTQGFFCHQLHKTLLWMYGDDYDRKFMQTAKALYIENNPFIEIFSQTFGEDSEIILKSYREASLDEEYQARAGMLDFVKKLRDRNVILLILSNRTRLINHRLKQAGYDPDQFMIYPAENKKPHPLAYAEVITDLVNLGISAEETLIIGNHPDDYHALPDYYKTNSTFIALPTSDQSKEAFLQITGETGQNVHICNHISELSNIHGRIFQT